MENYSKLIDAKISTDLTWNKNIENIVANMWIVYAISIKTLRTGQYDIVTP